MANATTYQCPNCSGVLAYNAETGYLTCEFCGGAFEEGELERDIPLGEGAEVQETDHVKTVGEFLERATWNELDAAAANAKAYSCPSCGAEVVADQATVSTECPYCGNTMLVSGIATAENVPRYVIPFEVTKDEAKNAMRQHFEHKWYLSRQFNASLEHIQGVYVPYHLYDMTVSGRAEYIAYNEVSDGEGNSDKWYYGMKRAGHASFARIPVDGSSKMPDAHMDSIAPFNFGKMRDFTASYVAGYLTEVADETPEACQPRAEKRVRHTFEEGLKDDAKRARKIDGIEEVVSHETNVQLTGVTSCVLPVWLMHCTWGAEQMLFAVNGETGRCVGDLPIDNKRRVATIIVTAVIAMVIAVVGSMILSGKGTDSIGGYFVGSIILVALVSLVVDAHFKGQMRTAVEATGAGMSYTEEGLVITERLQTKKSYARKAKALEKLQEGLLIEG